MRDFQRLEAGNASRIANVGGIASRPVSRVLYGSDSRRNVAAIHLGRRLRAASRNPPGWRTRKRVWRLRAHAIPIRSCSRRGLPCRPCRQVRGGLLPHLFTLTRHAGRSVFCGTFPGVAPAGRYPAPCFRGARTFLTSRPFDLLRSAAARPTGRACLDQSRHNRKAKNRDRGDHVANEGRESHPE